MRLTNMFSQQGRIRHSFTRPRNLCCCAYTGPTLRRELSAFSAYQIFGIEGGQRKSFMVQPRETGPLSPHGLASSTLMSVLTDCDQVKTKVTSTDTETSEHLCVVSHNHGCLLGIDPFLEILQPVSPGHVTERATAVVASDRWRESADGMRLLHFGADGCSACDKLAYQGSEHGRPR
jgi:hypothetical protein